MWQSDEGKESQTKTEELFPQHTAQKRSTKGTANDTVLFVQCLLCLALLAFVFLSSAANTPYSAQLSSACAQLLNEGMDLSSEAPLVRFANKSVSELRFQAGALLQQVSAQSPSTGLGGASHLGKAAIPTGASLAEYALAEHLFAPVSAPVSSSFGFRTDPFTGGADFHTGMDFAAAEGTPVCAAANGLVYSVGYTPVRGNYVILHHRAGLQTLYQHLQCSYVRVGEMVQAGQCLALSGSTGEVTGPHLHFELIVDGLRVNPEQSICS